MSVFGPWTPNDGLLWCPSCGAIIGRPEDFDDGTPDECRDCGFPDDTEAMADYHLGDDDEDDGWDDGWDDCGLMPDGTCMNAGTEWCAWACPHR